MNIKTIEKTYHLMCIKIYNNFIQRHTITKNKYFRILDTNMTHIYENKFITKASARFAINYILYIKVSYNLNDMTENC